jgi:hypothetical protein
VKRFFSRGLGGTSSILHFVGMALLIGTVGLLDVRILGIAKGVPLAALEKLVPVGIAGSCRTSPADSCS